MDDLVRSRWVAVRQLCSVEQCHGRSRITCRPWQQRQPTCVFVERLIAHHLATTRCRTNKQAGRAGSCAALVHIFQFPVDVTLDDDRRAIRDGRWLVTSGRRGRRAGGGPPLPHHTGLGRTARLFAVSPETTRAPIHDTSIYPAAERARRPTRWPISGPGSAPTIPTRHPPT